MPNNMSDEHPVHLERSLPARPGPDARAIILHREKRCFEGVVLGGLSRQALADELNITKRSVNRILVRINTRITQDLADLVLSHKARMHERHERIFQQAMTAWEKSKGEHRRQIARRTEVDGKPVTVSTLEVEESAGEPQYLAKALDALKAQRELWGLDAPKVLSVAPVMVNRPLRDLTDAELEAEGRQMQRQLEQMFGPAPKGSDDLL
jgi:plasmid maintenance system antidote protein VapI